MAVPAERIRVLNGAPVRADRALVVYWMTCNRRLRSNPALERAVALARELGKPVLIHEPVRLGYPYASDRLHAFLLEGMAATARALEGRALHFPWVERRAGEGAGLLEALAAHACAVITDDYPTFFVPEVLAAAAQRLDVRLEAVDGSCLVPFRLAGRDFPTAYAYRRWLQGVLPEWLGRLPAQQPLSRAPPPGRVRLPAEVVARWAPATAAELAAPLQLVPSLPVDHAVPPSRTLRGGSAEGEARLAAFVSARLARYGEDRNDPDAGGASGLSPWLHFGQVGTFDVVRAVLRAERWSAERLTPVRGARHGFWGLSEAAEGFLDQLVTWRELGFVTCAHRPDHRQYGSLPPWARATLAAHAADPRPALYDDATLAAGRTGDRIWNAAQRQLREEGVIQGYLRMLWGKKLLEWSRTPEQALERMLELNDRWALDGRDPNSVTGIFWCLGRYDRPWGPERPIFGTVRYMSSENTRRKLKLGAYLDRYAPDPGRAPEQGSLFRAPAR
ncbi:MAG: deoxyribodipyrimidine photo-lyase [Anaeromyxobacter sp.]